MTTATGGLQMFDYRAPQGRPQSCPPMDVPLACATGKPESLPTPRYSAEALAKISDGMRRSNARGKRKADAVAARMNRDLPNGDWIYMSVHAFANHHGHTLGWAAALIRKNGWQTVRVANHNRIVRLPRAMGPKAFEAPVAVEWHTAKELAAVLGVYPSAAYHLVKGAQWPRRRRLVAGVHENQCPFEYGGDPKTLRPKKKMIHAEAQELTTVTSATQPPPVVESPPVPRSIWARLFGWVIGR